MPNWSAVVLLGLVHVLVVYPIMAFGRSHESMWAHLGAIEFPRLTWWALRYSTSPFPHVVGGSFAVLSVVGLGYVMITGKGRHHLPFFVSIAWAILLIHVLAVWAGLSLPFARIMFGMTGYR